MPLVTDMLGRQVEVPAQSRRIVSLVPSQTELLADLGLEEEVVGITKFCIHPRSWFRSKTRIGGTKTVHIDRVAALKPDLIIANKEENVAEQIAALEQIAPVWVSDIADLGDALKMIYSVGKICGRAVEAEKIANEVATLFGALQSRVALSRKYTDTAFGKARNAPIIFPVGGKAAYCIWREPWMWAGGDTFISDLLDRCGLVNVLHQQPRYPEVNLEALAQLKPDFVFLSSEPYPFKEKHIAEVRAALPEAKVLLVDGEMFSWYGSRLLKAAEYLAGLLSTL